MPQHQCIVFLYNEMNQCFKPAEAFVFDVQMSITLALSMGPRVPCCAETCTRAVDGRRSRMTSCLHGRESNSFVAMNCIIVLQVCQSKWLIASEEDKAYSVFHADTWLEFSRSTVLFIFVYISMRSCVVMYAVYVRVCEHGHHHHRRCTY